VERVGYDRLFVVSVIEFWMVASKRLLNEQRCFLGLTVEQKGFLRTSYFRLATGVLVLGVLQRRSGRSLVLVVVVVVVVVPPQLLWRLMMETDELLPDNS
jgi:hypothetical protein